MKCRFFWCLMSIAVSATILPSRLLSGMLMFMLAIANAAIGYAGYCAEVDKMHLLITVLVSSLLSLTMFLRYYRRQHLVRLDISDSGDIIFRVMGADTSRLKSLNVKLSERSTLWPHLMLLSLFTDDGKNIVLPILRDSIDTDTYRKLSVALNWIARHGSSRMAFGSDSSSGNF